VPHLILLLSSIMLPLAWLVPNFMGIDTGHYLEPLLSGMAIVSAAFLLSWATELAELYVPPAFALIVLALVSVLPEYAIDIHFAWEAATNPAYEEYAVANMTGANRMLVGLGWSSLVLVLFMRSRVRTLEVNANQRVPLGFLLIATLYSFILPIKGTLSLWDSAFLFLIFVAYVRRALSSDVEEAPLVGPANWIAERCGDGLRITTIVFFLVYACFVIWSSAEPFADGLIKLGLGWNIDEYILVQMVAPLASEAPEFIVAILFVLKGRASTALGALISSKVNQWTLLVGAIPIAYSLGSGEIRALELAARPQEELLITSAQSLFAIAVLADLRFTLAEALVLFGLFAIQLMLPFEGVRYAFSGIYFLLVLVLGFSSRQRQADLSRLLRLN
jgi:cation:H+ antiporter